MINVTVSQLKDDAPQVAFTAPNGMQYAANGQPINSSDRFEETPGDQATKEHWENATAVQFRYLPSHREEMLKVVAAIQKKYPHLKKVKDNDPDPQFDLRLYTISTGGRADDNLSATLAGLGITIE